MRAPINEDELIGFSWKREDERSSVYFRTDNFIRLDGYDEMGMIEILE